MCLAVRPHAHAPGAAALRPLLKTSEACKLPRQPRHSSATACNVITETHQNTLALTHVSIAGSSSGLPTSDTFESETMSMYSTQSSANNTLTGKLNSCRLGTMTCSLEACGCTGICPSESRGTVPHIIPEPWACACCASTANEPRVVFMRPAS